MSDYINNKSRRDFVKKVAYVAPVILSMKALPALANTGSHKCCDLDNKTYSSSTNHPHHHNNHHNRHWW